MERYLGMLSVAVGRVLFLCCFLLAGTACVFAQEGYPKPVDEYVNDFAGVMNVTDKEAVSAMFKALEYKTGVEAVVVTIGSVREYESDDVPIETFALRLFNAWGIGRGGGNKGVLLLVAVADQGCRIELGQGYGHSYDAVMGEVINKYMVPCFQDQEYSRGIFEGARAVAETVATKASFFSAYKWDILIAVLLAFFAAAGISCMRSGKSGWGWAFFAAAGALLLALGRMLAPVKQQETGQEANGKQNGPGERGRGS